MTKSAGAVTSNDIWETLKNKLGLGDEPAKVKNSKSANSTWDSTSLLKPCVDGERTSHLVGLAGTYIGLGLTVDQTVEHCLMWNRNNTEPLDDAKVIATCNSIAATDARNHPTRTRFTPVALLQPPAPVTPLFSIADARIDTFLTSAPPPMRWVLDGLLPLGIVAALVAQGGAGKSQLLMQLAVSVATGILLAGFWPVGEAGTVLMLCAEDSREEIHRRVHRIFQQVGSGMTPAQRKLLEHRCLIRSMSGEDLLLTANNGQGEVTRTTMADRLLLTVKGIANLKLIIIDPSSRFRGGDENSNADATRFVQALEYLAQATGATILIAHHTGKGAINSGEINQTASRGASALTDGIRWQMALTPLTDKTKGYAAVSNDIRHNYLEAKLVKTNYTAPKPPVLLERCQDGYLQVVPMTTAGGPMAHTVAAIKDLLRILAGSTSGMTARQFEKLHGGTAKTMKVSERKTRELLDEARNRGLLTGGTGKPLTVTAEGKALIAADAQEKPSAARQLPRGNAARRTKTQ